MPLKRLPILRTDDPQTIRARLTDIRTPGLTFRKNDAVAGTEQSAPPE